MYVMYEFEMLCEIAERDMRMATIMFAVKSDNVVPLIFYL